ncbi:MAG: hypothetical protein CMM99_00635 [Rickettsiales bacterium]|nr:hypothetical protein [Rickettsiales bacterium]|tara:strand:+ start:650 stop:1186 length:537 start_codon:yes stop_codon:yes gene_type:complete
MADVTAQFTVYKGNSPAELKQVATVLKQSNFRDALQLVKQKPYNNNIFVNPSEKQSIIEFLVPHEPLSILNLAPIVLLFFTPNYILTKDEFNKFNTMVNYFKENNNSKSNWENKWASLEDESFLREAKPYLQLVSSRSKSIDLSTNSVNDWPSVLTTYFKSPLTNESFSMISYDTNLL